MASRRDAEAELNLPPGFRFHPTDEELVVYYLSRKATNKPLPVPIIAEVDLYKYDPWDLPEMALFGRKEWYFFTPRDRKYPNGSRPNRMAGGGYWKATGADRPIVPGNGKLAGIKKALVFYAGKAPRGSKTDWIMHEYRLTDQFRRNIRGSMKLDDWVLCRIYNKKNNYEKKPPQPKKQASIKEETDTFEGSESGLDGVRTPESDIDNDAFMELGDLDRHAGYTYQDLDQNFSLKTENQYQALDQTFGLKPEPKDDAGWFQDLDFGDLQNPQVGYGMTTMPDVMYQCYGFSGF